MRDEKNGLKDYWETTEHSTSIRNQAAIQSRIFKHFPVTILIDSFIIFHSLSSFDLWFLDRNLNQINFCWMWELNAISKQNAKHSTESIRLNWIGFRTILRMKRKKFICSLIMIPVIAVYIFAIVSLLYTSKFYQFITYLDLWALLLHCGRIFFNCLNWYS